MWSFSTEWSYGQPLVGRRREALLGASLLITNSAATVAAARAANPWRPDVEVVWMGVSVKSHPIDVDALPPVGFSAATVATEIQEN
jgi:hypothetical protein